MASQTTRCRLPNAKAVEGYRRVLGSVQLPTDEAKLQQAAKQAEIAAYAALRSSVLGAAAAAGTGGADGAEGDSDDPLAKELREVRVGACQQYNHRYWWLGT